MCVIASAVAHNHNRSVGCACSSACDQRPARDKSQDAAPFLAAIVVALLLVAFVPEIVLVVPRFLGFVR